MYDANKIQGLKRDNISVDGEKTKDRLTGLWKPAGKDNREEIMELSGLSKFSVARAYKTGIASAKIIIPFAQVFNVDPNYLTGSADEQGECTDVLLKKFLSKLGYKRKYTKRKKKDETDKKPVNVKGETKKEVEERFNQEMIEGLVAEAAEDIKESDYYMACNDENVNIYDIAKMLNATNGVTDDFLNEMTEETMVTLLRSSLLKADAGMGVARAKVIKRLLLI